MNITLDERPYRKLQSSRRNGHKIIANLFLLGSMVAGSAMADAVPTHQCAQEAKNQARKLLAFHMGTELSIEIQDTVLQRNAVSNPANPSQRFDVLEVWGYLYKGQYRMRFLYARMPSLCVLMGQEILEYAEL